jgi:hypothetical protein
MEILRNRILRHFQQHKWDLKHTLHCGRKANNYLTPEISSFKLCLLLVLGRKSSLGFQKFHSINVMILALASHSGRTAESQHSKNHLV